jgi:hypothetical protein
MQLHVPIIHPRMMKLQQFSNFDDLKPAENVAHPVNKAAFAAYKKWMDELRSKLTVIPEVDAKSNENTVCVNSSGSIFSLVPVAANRDCPPL